MSAEGVIEQRLLSEMRVYPIDEYFILHDEENESPLYKRDFGSFVVVLEGRWTEDNRKRIIRRRVASDDLESIQTFGLVAQRVFERICAKFISASF